ncbi:MAG: DUF58 domain-containing protein [Clostridiaceae bacterium]|nr:DUF58 domain-containing protein [Clostridiaceae bacterium]
MQIFIVIALVMMLIAIQLIVYKRLALHGIFAGIEFSTPIAECGETITISEKIENRKRLPLVLLILRFEAPRELHFPDMTNTALSDLYYREDLISLGGWKRHFRHIQVRCRKRGYYEFKRLSVTTCDPLMLVKIYGFFSSDSTLTVLPRFLNTPDIEALFMSSIGERISRKSSVSNPFTFAGIREYQPWDSFGRINWKASARKGEWMVNTPHCTICPEITIVLNVARYSPNRSTDLIEKAISLAYSFVAFAVRESLPVSIISNSRDILTEESISKPHGSGPEHLRDIGLSLSRIDLNKTDTGFDGLFESLPFRRTVSQWLILSPNTDASVQATLLRHVKEGTGLVWIVPRNADQPAPSILPELVTHTVLWEERYEAHS